MTISLIIWLCVCAALIIASFWTGLYYLSECVDYWKKYVRYSALPDKYDAGERAEAKISKTITTWIWVVCFVIAFSFVGIVGYLLFSI